MPKQSTHVAGYIAPFSLCEIYRSNINDNSYLMSAAPPPSAHPVLFSKLSHTTFRQLRCVRWRRYWDKMSTFSQVILVHLFAMWWFYFNFYSRQFCWPLYSVARAAKSKARLMFLTDECELCINLSIFCCNKSSLLKLKGCFSQKVQFHPFTTQTYFVRGSGDIFQIHITILFQGNWWI